MTVWGDNDKIEICTPKISLINNIGNLHNYPSKYTQAIADSGSNINLSKQATPEMAPEIMS